MSVVLEWKVKKLLLTNNLHNIQNVVAAVVWTLTANYYDANGVKLNSLTHEQQTFIELPGVNFIPYENLTEEIVLGWVKPILGSRAKHLEINLSRLVVRDIISEEEIYTSTDVFPWN